MATTTSPGSARRKTSSAASARPAARLSSGTPSKRTGSPSRWVRSTRRRARISRSTSSSPTRAITTRSRTDCRRTPSKRAALLRLRGDALDFDARAHRQAARTHGATCGVGRREGGLVHLVEGGPLEDVSEHHGALDDVAHRVAVRLERRLDVLERLPRLFLDSSRHQLERARLDADLAGEEEHVADAYSLREGQRGRHDLAGV